MYKYPSFPITGHLDEICSTLKQSSSHFLILTAETAAGKSTVLPVALLNHFSKENGFCGKLLMTEPRRLAVLSVAKRVSALCNEECGKTVGYKIHLENKTSEETKLEFVTEAILVRMLQEDPAIEKYNVIVLDEFHERSINTDMALAFLKEAMEIRDDLFVIVMSATMDSKKLQEYLGGEKVPVMNIPGRNFPVEVEYNGKISVTDAVCRELKNQKGDILVFLPGISSIRKCESELKSLVPDDVEISILHSSISLDEQKYILTPSSENKKRVILSSSIAETSLTVPGITCVIDSGLSRVSRMNVAKGLPSLVTETESEFSSEQRKGRAGRVQSGKCLRLWNETEPRVKNMPPEILRTDISSLILECADRGLIQLEKINFLDNPHANAWEGTKRLLQNIELLDNEGRITPKGKAALLFPLEPRFAAMVLTAGKKGFKDIQSVLLSNSQYSQSNENLQKRFLTDIENRLSRHNDFSSDLPSPLLILSGYPDRLALRLSPAGALQSEYQLANGKKAILKKGVNNAPKWLVALEAMSGTTHAVIYEYQEIASEMEKLLEDYVLLHSSSRIECSFENGKVKKVQKQMFGEITVSEKRIPSESSDLVKAWKNEVLKKGFECLPLNDRTRKFLLRAKFYFSNKEQKSPSQLESELVSSMEEWLSPFLGNEAKLSEENLYNALYWKLDGGKIDQEVPEIYILPNKVKAKVVYEVSENNTEIMVRPVIEIIIQRIFGCFTTPVICGQKVLLKLLSPASRPLQITDDLENFWTSTWPEICREMKGRYPKHNWDYRIAEKD